MRKWLPLAAVCLGAFMLLVDITIVTVALPDMARSLDASFSGLQWVLDSYALALAALLLATGAMADLIGRKKTYVAGLALFAAASLACGAAPTAGALIAARGLQGLGGAAMFTATLAVINSTYAGKDRGIAFGVWGAVNGVAAAAGPLLGGLITEHLNWRAIFFVNLPSSLIALALTLIAVAESRRPAGARVDLSGMSAFTVAAGALTFGLIRAGDSGWASSSTLGLFAMATAALVVFVLVERRSPHPLLDLGLLRNPSFAGIMIGALLVTGSAFSCLVFVSLWLQSVLGLGPVAAGLTLMPMACASFVVSATVGRFLQSVTPRLTIGIGLLLIGAGSALQGTLDAASSRTAIIPGLILGGIGVGMAIPALASATLATVPPDRGGMASGAVNTARQLGFALGVALLGLVFRTRVEDLLVRDHVPDPHRAANALTNGAATSVLPGLPQHLVRSAFASGVNASYAVSAAMGLAAGVLVLALVRKPGPHITPQDTERPKVTA
jgi:EmrB/QacA subfamily drug resistance transporter